MESSAMLHVIIPILLVSINSLPTELLRKIFIEALGEFWIRPWENPFVVSRSRMVLVCRDWRMILVDMKYIWSDFRISHRSNTGFIKTCLLRSSPVPVILDITFTNDGAQTAHHVLAALEPGFPRTQKLVIRSANTEITNSITPLISAAEFRQLRTLTIESRLPPHPAIDVPLIFIAAGLQSVRAVRLTRVSFGWDISHSFTSLHTLVLRNIGRRFAPTWNNWLSLSAAAPGLMRLCLRNIGCSDVPSNADLLIFAKLEVLDLAFGDDNPALASLITALRSSALKSLLLSSRTTHVLHCLLATPETLTRLHDLVIRISSCDDEILRRLFDATAYLATIDIHLSDRSVFDVLGETIGHSTFRCPGLAVYACINATPFEFVRLMKKRASLQSTVTNVVFVDRIGAKPEFESEIEWLEQRMGVGYRPDAMEPRWLEADD